MCGEYHDFIDIEVNSVEVNFCKWSLLLNSNIHALLCNFYKTEIGWMNFNQSDYNGIHIAQVL